jgi:T5SS/PEP-CTERM-associated repeat protein
VTGAESSYTVQSDIWLGYRGSNNSITVENGARLSNDDNPVFSGYLFVGRGSSDYLTMGRQNSATVQGTDSVWNNSNTVVLGEYGSENSINVRDGGTFTSGSMIIGQNAVTVGGVTSGMNNELLVTGADSVWQNVGSVAIGKTGNSGNRLVVQDRGLAMIGDGIPGLDAQDNPVPDTFTVALGNHVRIDGGYIALFGDQQAVVSALIDAGAFQVLQGGVWTDATAADIQFAYFATGADTSSFTDGYYDNLGGYTVVTAVPEPSTAILLFGACVVGIWMLRRRKATH